MAALPPLNGSRRIRALLIAALLSLSQAGCEDDATALRVHHQIGGGDRDRLHAIFEEQSPVRFVPGESSNHLSSLQALCENRVDLGLIENSVPFTAGLRAVLPVFESVLHLLVRDDFEPVPGQPAMLGASIHVMNQSAAGHEVIDLLMRRQGLKPGQYTLSETLRPGETDLVIYFGPINPDDTHWHLPGYSLLSLGNRHNPHRQFFREGISYSVPNMRPVTIPALTYFVPGNEESLQSLAVDTVLITRKEVDEGLIYELTRTLLEQKQRFVAINPQLFSGINESFDPLSLNFPLHAGARRYLHRDEPGLLERYAESINLLLYLTFLLITGLFGLARWRQQRKKDRIDRFYTEIMTVRGRIGQAPEAQLLEQLLTLEREAFDALIREKLAANDSFLIFTQLLAQARAELQRASRPSTDA